jgi:plasmid stability protein
MGQLVISDIDTSVIARIGERAARHGRSLEGEVKSILIEAIGGNGSNAWSAADQIRLRLAGSGRSFSDSADLIREDRQR